MLHDHLMECIGALILILLGGYVFLAKSAKNIDEGPVEKRPEDYTVEDFRNMKVPPEEAKKIEAISEIMWENIQAGLKAKRN